MDTYPTSGAAMKALPRLKLAWHRHNASGYAFILPALLVILCLVAYPFVMAIYLSLTDAWVGTEGKFVGFRNYSDLVHNDIFLQTLKNSLIFTFCAVTVKTALGMALALLLNAKIRFQRIFRGAILLPWVIPNTMSTLGWLWMFDPLFSVLNWVLKHAGLIQTNVSWLSNPYWAMFSIITVNVWRGLPFFAITLLAGLVSIPQELYKAAHIDGAGAARCFFRITLPLLKPLLLIVILFSTISTISDFNIDHILPPAGPKGRFAFADCLTLGIWEFSKNKELAKEFLKYHFAKKQFDEFLEVAVGYNVPFLQGYRTHAVFTSDPKIGFIGEIGKYEHTIGYPGPVTAQSQVVWDMFIISDMFSYAATGKKSPKEAVEWAEKEITSIYAGKAGQ